MPRNGRPPSKNPKNTSLHLRLTKGEYKMIEQCAASHNLTKTQAILKGIEYLKEKPTC